MFGMNIDKCIRTDIILSTYLRALWKSKIVCLLFKSKKDVVNNKQAADHNVRLKPSVVNSNVFGGNCP